jgi:hypothetical protein
LASRYSITSHKFEIGATVHVPEYDGDLLQWGRRISRHVTTGRGEVLLDTKTTRLLDILADGPGNSLEDRIAYAAEVKRLGLELGAGLGEVLGRETFELVESVNAAAVVEADGSIRVEPRFEHPALDEAHLSTLSPELPYQETRAGKGRRRIIVGRRARDGYRTVRETAPHIPSADVVRFVENPQAFVPENWPIDLELFSRRVKGLKLRAYRAQPFVFARGTDRGWFDLESGIRLDPSGSEGRDDSVSSVGADGSEGALSLDEFERLVDRAEATGSRTVFDGTRWVELPHDARQTANALAKLRAQLGSGDPSGTLRIDASRLPYVLDIFTNVETFEFNAPFIQELERRQVVLAATPPASFHGTLHPYQLDGFRRLLRARGQRLGLLLADEMGLGKTVQVLAALAQWKAEGLLRPSLLVVPLTLIANWERECQTFAPTLTVHVHHGPERRRFAGVLEDVDVVIASYDTVIRDQLDLGQIDWHVVILDEAQRIKNASTSRTSAIKALKAAHRIALTGTPVENDLSDLWSICDFVQPGFLGSSRDFTDLYRPGPEHMSDTDWAAHGEALAERLAPILLRRTKADVALALPRKQVVERRVPLGKVQYDRYRDVISEVHAKTLTTLEAIGHLRALAAHPLALESRPNWASLPAEQVPKLAETLNILGAVKSADEKALIFTENRRVQEMLRYWIGQRFDVYVPIINGTTPNRQWVVDLFSGRPGFGVMILSPMAAGVGLNIVAANHVIHYTRWWNPAVESQATDRVHRMGQKRPVTVYYPIAVDPEGLLQQGTVEEIVDRLLREKAELATRSLIPMRDDDLRSDVMERTFGGG